MRRALAIVWLAACGSSKSAPPKPQHDAGAPAIDAAPPEPDRAVFPGDPYVDLALPPGTLKVKAPGQITLHVVGIDVDGKLTDAEHRMPASGELELTGLVTDGTVAYHIVGNNVGTPIESAPIVPRPDAGMRVEVNTRVPDSGAEPNVVEAWITVMGATDATDVTLVDVATGDNVTPVGSFAGDYGPVFRFAHPRWGHVFVAKLRHASGEQVSRPFLSQDGVPVQRMVMTAPFPMAQCIADLRRGDTAVKGWTRCDVMQSGGAPRRQASAMHLPLPVGASAVTLLDPKGPVQPDALTGGLVWTTPIAPGNTRVDVTYDLAIVNERVAVDLTATNSLTRLGVRVEAAPSIDVIDVEGGQHQPPDFGQGDSAHLIWADYVTAGHRLRFTVTGVKRPTPCEQLVVAKWTATGDPAPAPDVSAERRDGTTVKLSDLRGKPVLLNLFASWTPPSAEEIPKLLAAERAFAAIGVQVLIVASDDDWPAVDKLIDPKTGVTVWIDRPGGSAYTLGAVAHAFGTKALPETYLIDAQGLVRAWIVNSRDWTTPEAVGCIQSLTQPWTGTVTVAPPPYTPPPKQLGGTLSIDPALTVPPGAIMYLVVRPSDGGAPISLVRVDNPTFPQAFAFAETDQLTAGRPISGTVQVSATIDLDGDFMTVERGNLSGVAYATGGDLGVRLTIDQMVQ